MTRLEKITFALDRLNWEYGRGDIREVREMGNGSLEFDRQPYMMKIETRKARIIGKTVYALGHQATIRS